MGGVDFNCSIATPVNLLPAFVKLSRMQNLR